VCSMKKNYPACVPQGAAESTEDETTSEPMDNSPYAAKS